jgi:hypothetical protein
MDRLSQMNAQFTPAAGQPATAGATPARKDTLSVLDNRTGKDLFFYI